MSFKEKHGIPIINSTAAMLLGTLILAGVPHLSLKPDAQSTVTPNYGHTDFTSARSDSDYYDYSVYDYYDTATPSKAVPHR